MRFLPMLAVAFALGLAFPGGRARGEEEPAAALLARVAPAVVSVHGTLEQRWSGDGSAQEKEVAFDGVGAVVDPGGIVLLRNATVGGSSPEIEAWRKQNDIESYSATPTSLVVLFGNDPTEHAAAVLAQDSRLDLAFLQLLGGRDKPFAYVDLTKGAAPRVGQELLGVRRSGRGFDFAPIVETLYVSSRVEKPRALWALRGDFEAAGLPVFARDGAPVGVVAELQAPADSATGDDRPDEARFAVPLDAVLKSLEAARKKVPEVLAKAAEAKAAAPKPAPAAPAPGPAPEGEPKPPEGTR
jgi:hypothetical protein